MDRPHFRNMSLRAKLAVLLIVASSLPLAIVAFLHIEQTREELVASMKNVLEARADQLARELDSTHAGYQRAAARLARFPTIQAYCSAGPRERTTLEDFVAGTLQAFPASDSFIRGAGLIDASGKIIAGSDPRLRGTDVANRARVRQALNGANVVAGIYLSSQLTGEKPRVAYLSPVRRGAGEPACVAVVWVEGDALLRGMKASHGMAGPGSYGTLFDEFGIRIANTGTDAPLYRPSGTLAPDVLDGFIAEGRFGARTRELLQDTVHEPERFARATASQPDKAVFRALTQEGDAWSYGIARRLEHVPWTVFYFAPDAVLAAQLKDAALSETLVSGAFILAAALLGLWFAQGILRPVGALADATAQLAAGNSGVRVVETGGDELARLGTSFNAMARRLEAQSNALQLANDRLEQRVRERTGLLNAVMDNSATAISLKDLDGRFLLLNDRGAAVFGRPRKDIIGKRVRDMLEPEAAARIEALDAVVIASDHALVEEQTTVEADGTHTYLMMKCRVDDELGRPVGIVSLGTDITDRKQAEMRVLDQLERLKLLDQITSAIGSRLDLQSIYQVVVHSLEERLPVDFCCVCSLDAATNTLTLIHVGAQSERLAQAMGLDGDARIPVDQAGLARCVAGELLHDPDTRDARLPFSGRMAAGGLASMMLAPLKTESQVFGVLVAARKEAGAFKPADCEFVRQLCGHVAIAADQAQLTDALRRAYNDLRESQAKLLQQERLSALGQMASGIAHDINNAISPVTLYTESLLTREPGLSEQARKYLEVISRAIDDVASTVARMREFYRPSDTRAEPLAVDLNELVGQVVELTRARWSDMPQERGIVIELDTRLAPGLPRISGVASEVREALINLVFNAIDAMPQGGRLSLCTRPCADAARVELDVIDNGVGMDETTRQRCLEPFFTTKGERGTGLGLSMVYGVIQRHGATVDIDSDHARGTRVRLSFPVQPGEAGPPPPAPLGELAPRMRILLIDDDALLRNSLRDTLRADGHKVAVADGGKAGIDAFLAAAPGPEAFEAVITDLGMARVDGRQVAAAIKRASPSTPVIMLTGWGQRMSDGADRPRHVDLVLGKPPKLQGLRDALREVSAAGSSP